MTYERWTDRARRSVVLAQECARTLNHAEISPGHMLAGLMAEGGGVAYLALTASGLNAGDVTDALAKRGQRAEVEQPPNIPFSPRGKKACELALRESLRLGHNFIGTEHVLLGLIREGDGTGADILVTLGLSPLDVRAKVLELLAGYESAGGAGPAASPAPAPERVAVKLNPGLRIITITNTASEDEISFSEPAWIAFIASVRNGRPA